jgi:hypothetical protein
MFGGQYSPIHANAHLYIGIEFDQRGTSPVPVARIQIVDRLVCWSIHPFQATQQ